MLLRRLGSKSNILPKILPLIPQHDCYFEVFFGTGSLFWNKPLTQYNYLNDLDNDVFNLFQVVKFHSQELYDYIESIPYHKAAWTWIKTLEPANDIEKAVKFVILSNYGLLGKPDALHFAIENNKKQLLQNILKTNDFLNKNSNSTIMFNNMDFRAFFKEFGIRLNKERKKIFCYLDPPYLGTVNNYSHSFMEQDSIDLFDTVMNENIKFAMSEFDNPFILDQASKRGLKVANLGKRKNLNNRRTEILIVNYDIQQKLIF